MEEVCDSTIFVTLLIIVFEYCLTLVKTYLDITNIKKTKN